MIIMFNKVQSKKKKIARLTATFPKFVVSKSPRISLYAKKKALKNPITNLASPPLASKAPSALPLAIL